MKCIRWLVLAVVVSSLSVTVVGCGMSRWLGIEEAKDNRAAELQSTQQNSPPTVSEANQYRSNGTTGISEGGRTCESTVAFKARVSDSNNDKVKLQIELRQVSETFRGTPTWESTWVSSGTTVSWTRGGLVNASYKWQYRAVDARGLANPWKEFGTAGNTDFVVLVVRGAWTFYSQNDSQWSCNQLGTCSRTTIGRCENNTPAGCAVTAAAMLLRSVGAGVNPGTLNSWLINNYGYSRGCDIIWSKVADYDGPGCLAWEGTGSLTTPQTLKSLLDQGRLIIARSQRFPQHWVVIRGYDGQGSQWSDFWYWDPWDNTATTRRLGDGWVGQGASIRIYRYQQ